MENNKKKILIDEDFLEDKMTYEKLVNMPSDEMIDYPKETDDSMMKFVALSVTVMAIVICSLILFHLI